MKKNEKSIPLFSTVSPEDLTQRLLEIGVEEKFIKNHFPKYFYIIDKIYTNDVINKNEEFCRLSSDLLRNILGSYYAQILQQLTTIGVIQLASNYYAGSRSNGYVLLENRGAKTFEFFDEHRFVRKILQNKISRVQKDTRTLARLFRSLSNIQYEHIDKNSLDENEFKFLYFLENNLFQIEGERGKRVYNNFTNLPKTIRSKVKLDGQELVYVDIVNSQMVFLAAVIEKTIINKNRKIDDTTAHFIKLASSGKLYEFLMQNCGIDDRGQLKDYIFQIIFGYQSSQKNISQKFNELFPQVINVIKYLKKEDYKVLSHQMQNMEAKVVFRALDSINYHKDILTVHDSLYAQKNEKNTILEALVASFKSEGLEAVLNVNDEYIVKVSEFSEDKIAKIFEEPIPVENNSTSFTKSFSDKLIEQEQERIPFINELNLPDYDLKCWILNNYKKEKWTRKDYKELAGLINWDHPIDNEIIEPIRGKFKEIDSRLKMIYINDQYVVTFNGSIINLALAEQGDENQKALGKIYKEEFKRRFRRENQVA